MAAPARRTRQQQAQQLSNKAREAFARIRNAGAMTPDGWSTVCPTHKTRRALPESCFLHPGARKYPICGADAVVDGRGIIAAYTRARLVDSQLKKGTVKRLAYSPKKIAAKAVRTAKQYGMRWRGVS